MPKYIELLLKFYNKKLKKIIIIIQNRNYLIYLLSISNFKILLDNFEFLI
jgi:hypothetical protein